MAWLDMTTAAKATVANPDIRRRPAAISCGHGPLSRKQSLGRRSCWWKLGFHLIRIFAARILLLVQRCQPRRPHHRHSAWRLRRHFGGDAAEQRARKRILARANDDMIDMIDFGKFQDRRRG